MTGTDTRRVFRVKFTTGDVTTCELCGRDDLRSTVMLAELDADGSETGDVCHYGSDCAARAAGWTARELGRRVRAADRERRQERERVYREYAELRDAAFIAWCGRELGVLIPRHARSDLSELSRLHDALRAAGRSVLATSIAWEDSADYTAFAGAHPDPD